MCNHHPTTNHAIVRVPLAIFMLVVASCGPTQPSSSALVSASRIAATTHPITTTSASLPTPSPEPIADVAPFAAVLRIEAPLQLFPLKDAVLAISQLGDDPTVYRVSDSEVAKLPNFFTGLRVAAMPEEPTKRLFRVDEIEGSASGDLDIRFNVPGERSGTDYRAERRAGVWKTDPPLRYLEGFMDGPAIITQSGLYLIAPADAPGTIKLYNGATALAATKGMPIPTKRDAAAGCTARMGPYYGLAAVGDRIFGIGRVCTASDAAGAWAVEEWLDGTSESVAFLELPGTIDTGLTAPTLFSPFRMLSHRGSILLYMAAKFPQKGVPSGRPYLARLEDHQWIDMSPPSGSGPIDIVDAGEGEAARMFLFAFDAGYRRDRNSWTLIEMPPREASVDKKDFDGDPDQFVAAKDGSIWARLDKKLYRLAPAGTRFERVELPDLPRAADEPAPTPGPHGEVAAPPRFEVDSVAFLPSGDPVVLAHRGWSSALYVPKAHAGPVVVESTPPPKTKPFGSVRAAGADCSRPFVVLYGMTKLAPDDYDFPLTRKALKGKRDVYGGAHFYVVRDGGQRFLIAIVPSLAMGAALTKDIAASVKDSKPQLLCGDPAEIIRELKIDLDTGEVIK
jgi:hypothetical protein